MKYRVRLDMSFDTEVDAKTIIDMVNKLQDKAVVINLDSKTRPEESSYIHYEQCGHDEGKPCMEISNWNKKTGVKV